MARYFSDALPEPLREERFDETNAEQAVAIKSLSTLEQLKTFIQATLDQQWERLDARWRPSRSDRQFVELEARLNVTVERRIDARLTPIEASVQTTPSRRINKRAGWERREKLYVAIQKILKLNPELEGIKFCAALDQRHVLPLEDWEKDWPKHLTWKQAWGISKLRRKIRRVRQEAQKLR
jgi:hypothetical protein